LLGSFDHLYLNALMHPCHSLGEGRVHIVVEAFILAPQRCEPTGSLPDDAGEVVGHQEAPPDERAVDVGLRHQLGRVAGLHRAAVLDAHGRRSVGAGDLGHHGTDHPHISWASSAVAVRPVPIAQIGS
jgi:hypothetical protein